MKRTLKNCSNGFRWKIVMALRRGIFSWVGSWQGKTSKLYSGVKFSYGKEIMHKKKVAKTLLECTNKTLRVLIDPFSHFIFKWILLIETKKYIIKVKLEFEVWNRLLEGMFVTFQ